jgi:peptidoglycan/LPS O-acetylase OafA/YrhL
LWRGPVATQLANPIEAESVSTSRYYRPELDALRAFAFLSVFASHIFYSGHPLVVRSGVAGVNLFFVLSSFLICELSLRERDKTQTVDVRKFYIRRVLRIWPVYYLVVLSSLVIAPNLFPVTAWYMVFIGPWYNYFHHSLIRHPAGGMWSISIEEQFYLLAPWIFRLERNYIYAICLLLISVSDITMWHLGSTVHYIGPNILVQVQAFSAGIIICLLLRSSLLSIPLYTRAILSISGICLWIFSERIGNLIGSYTSMTVGSSLLLLAFFGVDSKFIPKMLVYLGRRSYGLYAYHWYAIVLVSHVLSKAWGMVPKWSIKLVEILASLSISVVVASLSYRLFERRFLKLKDRFAIVETRPE